METHTIVIFDRAFLASTVRFGTPDALSAPTSYAVAHEVGHAIDRKRIRAALDKETAARQELGSKFGQFRTPSGDFVLNNVPLDVLAEFNRTLAKANRAQTATEAARTDSGSRFQRGTLADDPKLLTGFKNAAAGVRITPYAQTNWEEYYAESFALYSTDPSTLQRLRPKIFAFFAKNYPKKP